MKRRRRNAAGILENIETNEIEQNLQRRKQWPNLKKTFREDLEFPGIENEDAEDEESQQIKVKKRRVIKRKKRKKKKFELETE